MVLSKEKDRWRKIKTRYNLTPSEYYAIFELNDNKCEICGIDFAFAKGCLDHSHDDEGYLRGTLCNKHNLGISYFDDNIELLLSAVAYLEKYKKGNRE